VCSRCTTRCTFIAVSVCVVYSCATAVTKINITINIIYSYRYKYVIFCLNMFTYLLHTYILIYIYILFYNKVADVKISQKFTGTCQVQTQYWQKDTMSTCNFSTSKFKLYIIIYYSRLELSRMDVSTSRASVLQPWCKCDIREPWRKSIDVSVDLYSCGPIICSRLPVLYYITIKYTYFHLVEYLYRSSDIPTRIVFYKNKNKPLSRITVVWDIDVYIILNCVWKFIQKLHL